MSLEQIVNVAIGNGPESWAVVQGDCLELLSMVPNVCADVILTDPPYCSGGQLEAQRNTKAQGIRSQIAAAPDFAWFASDNMSTAGLVWLLRSVMVEANRVLKARRSAFVFTDYRMVPNLVPPLESCGMRYRNLIVWDKGYAGLGAGFKPAHELILEFSNGATQYRTRAGQNVLRFSRVHASKKQHGAEKPVDMLGAVLAQTVGPGGLVIDPFCGSGSTGVAALRAGARFIGFERDPRYVEVSRERLARAEVEAGEGCPPTLPSPARSGAPEPELGEPELGEPELGDPALLVNALA
jgi:DNA modification methylase